MFVVLELNRRAPQSAAAFDVDLLIVVDQDVRDGRIFHQRFQRAEAEHLVQDLLDDAVPLRQRHRDVLLKQELLDGAANFAPQPFFADQP